MSFALQNVLHPACKASLISLVDACEVRELMKTVASSLVSSLPCSVIKIFSNVSSLRRFCTSGETLTKRNGQINT
jgi:hypothetical protein